MATETTTTVTTFVIKLMNGGVNFLDTSVSSTTVGALRDELGLTGSISVNDVISSDNTPIHEHTDDNPCLVSCQGSGIKGGI